MGYISRKSTLLVLALGLHAHPVQADTFSGVGMFDSVGVYAGQGAHHNLRELPGRIVTRSVDWDKTYFAALGLGKVRGVLGEDIESLRGTPFAPLQYGYEMVLVQHSGLQNNAEAGAACMLRTPDLQLGRLGVNFAAGAGLSYAIGTPSYEDGSDTDPARRYHLQLLALFELEWRMIGLDKLTLVTRAHHRSGVYGLIAPRHVGSNFLAAGIRYRF